jgi:glyoxylase-like metal-dependent hydrolase (beta-lactamase superfamily II)
VLKRIFGWAAGVIGLSLLALIGGLGWANLAIRRVDPALPSVDAVLASRSQSEAGLESSDWPSRIYYINTASQPVPRGLVLEPSADPTPDAPYVMSHPSFVLEWPDGRLFLIDAGMPPEAAVAFGRPSELLGAGPTQTHGDVREQLADAATRVAGIAFTHLHSDHTSGLANLCEAIESLDIFQAPVQAAGGNYTTAPSEEQLVTAPCGHLQRLDDGRLLRIPGFPGLFVIQAAGHTPGSQILVAHVSCDLPGQPACAPQTWIFTGDVVNHIEGVRHNVPKPRWYSSLVVPESTGRLDELRRLLLELEAHEGVNLLVSHDQLQIQSSGVEKWPGPRRRQLH